MPKEWKIIFLIYADFFEGETQNVYTGPNIERELRALFADLRNTPTDDCCAVYAVLNSIKYEKTDNPGTQKKDKTIIYKVKNGSAGQPNDITQLATIHFDNSLQRKESLSSILNLIDNYEPSEKNFIITWDHGSVFGINKEEERPEIITILRSVNIDDIIKGRSEHEDNPAVNLFRHNREVFSIKQSQLNDFAFILNNQGFYNYLAADDKLELSLSEKFKEEVLAEFLKTNNGSIKNKVQENAINKDLPNGISNTIKLNNIKELLKNSVIQTEGEKLIIIHEPLGDIKINTPFQLNKEHFIRILDNQEPSFAIDFNYKLEILTNQELADAIEAGLKNKKADVLLMMNCNMMNIHTMGTLQGKVNFLIAPESGIDEPGYNYCAILKSITTETDPQTVANTCITTFNVDSGCGHSSCIYHRNTYLNQNASISLFAGDLRNGQLNSAIELINNFGKNLISKIVNEPDILSFQNLVKQNVESFVLHSKKGAELHLFDIDDCLSVLIEKINAFETLKEIIKNDLIKFQEELRNKRDIVINELQPGQKKFSPFAIFFPTDEVGTMSSLGPFIKDVQEKESQDRLSGWLGFLRHFFS
jgi:hypothetical protein